MAFGQLSALIGRYVGTRATFFCFVNLLKLPLRVHDGSLALGMLPTARPPLRPLRSPARHVPQKTQDVGHKDTGHAVCSAEPHSLSSGGILAILIPTARRAWCAPQMPEICRLRVRMLVAGWTLCPPRYAVPGRCAGLRAWRGRERGRGASAVQPEAGVCLQYRAWGLVSSGSEQSIPPYHTIVGRGCALD